MHETWELQHVLLGCLFFSAAAFLSEKQPGNLFSLTVLTFLSSPANPLKGGEINACYFWETHQWLNATTLFTEITSPASVRQQARSLWEGWCFLRGKNAWWCKLQNDGKQCGTRAQSLWQLCSRTCSCKACTQGPARPPPLVLRGALPCEASDRTRAAACATRCRSGVVRRQGWRSPW